VKVALLYPGTGQTDGVKNWAETVARHCKKHDVRLPNSEDLLACRDYDVTLLIASAATYPTATIDQDIGQLKGWSIPFGVIHNETNPGVPTPGEYPSFVWTKRAEHDLEEYAPILARMPVFEPIVPYEKKPLLVATFGAVEPKKMTWRMYDWARQVGVPFWAFAPSNLAAQYLSYIGGLRADGCEVRTYDWTDRVEDLSPLFTSVSHFLFYLPPTKAGSGGCSTSARYATFFNRPVIVVDDEMTCALDGYYVVDHLSLLRKRDLESMAPPLTDWSPDAYIECLATKTLEFWKEPCRLNN
jgi:hypothetical protein